MSAQLVSPKTKPDLTVITKQVSTQPVPVGRPEIRVAQRFPAISTRTRLVEALTLLALVFLSACASSNNLAVEPLFPEPAPMAAPQMQIDIPVPDVEVRLRTEIDRWIGTPHVYGGQSVQGIDCSAFVQQVYARALSLQLPRTTREQVHAGRPVERRDLRAGDLVFFRPPAKSRHVGIYLSGGDFAHASSSQGVTVSNIEDEYWDESFWTTRRILPESARPALADRTMVVGRGSIEEPTYAAPMTDQPKRERIGW